MQELAQSGYARDPIINALHGVTTSKQIEFEYDLLDFNEQKIGELDEVESGEVRMDKDAEIKRTASFLIRDNGDIDWLNDRIQPFYKLRMPSGDWLKWPQGIFLLPSPEREEKRGRVYRNVNAYDGLYLLKLYKFDYRLYFPKNKNYITAIREILNNFSITKINLEPCDDVLTNDRSWDPGTDALTIINELLKDISYTQIWADERGYYTAGFNKLAQDRASEYTYPYGKLSVTYPGVKETLNLFDVPNKWTVAVSNSSGVGLKSTYINDDPASQTSTVSRKITIPRYETIEYISSQAALYQYVKLLAAKDSQVYGSIPFSTAPMPMHSYNDILTLEYPPLDINGKYEELSWVLPLKGGEKMQHVLRRVMNI